MSTNEQRWAYGQGTLRLALADVAMESGDTAAADGHIAAAEEILEGMR